MAGYTYDSYVTALKTMLVSADVDDAFDAILPSIIDYAEQRIYRELNLISTVYTDNTTVTTVSGTRDVVLPQTFVSVTNINLLTPAGALPGAGVRVPLTPVSRDALDNLWPDPGATDEPQMFCMVTQWSILLGPTPNDTYRMEIVGTYRPDPLSSTNTTTFISAHLPDLFLAASMVFGAGYQRDFGAQTNDPQMGTAWEQQYQLLKASADTEEVRKRFAASSWSSQPVITQAQPQRG